MPCENPFTPSFGEIPAHLAGRKHLIKQLTRAYTSSRRYPELTSIISGARGTGKTTLLSLLANRAMESGWVIASVTALPGLLDDIEIETRRNAAHLVDTADNRKLASVTIAPIGGVSLEPSEPRLQNWRSRMSDLLEQLNDSGVGLLITVDEVDPNLPEMIELAAVYQHFVREQRRVALLMAGLPNNISALISDKSVSFLRRAQSYQLGRIADYEIESAFLKTINDYGRDAEPEGIKYAVDTIGGFPFLMQLIGYRSWDISPEEQTITLEDFQAGADIAQREIESRILDATYRELSAGDIDFLVAMLQDESDTRTADLVKRLGKSSAQVAQYRRRLIDAGVIGSPRRGVVRFELPFFRDYLKERL